MEDRISASKHSRSVSSDDPARKRARLEAPEPVAGMLVSIHLEDFMCHSAFHWNFNAGVNFVIGANGSGKSSILQAIVLGLMGQAKSTERYSKVSDFVKQDCNRAVLKIELLNKGEDAYKREVFGDSITFKTIIYKHRGSAFSLLDEKGNTLYKDKNARIQAQRILEEFNIFVENPLVILQQEKAKVLLDLESPESLFKLFHKGTMLEDILFNYREATNDLRISGESLAKKSATVERKKEELEEVKRKFSKMLERKKKSTEMKDAQLRYQWKKVQICRENLKAKEEEKEDVSAQSARNYEALMQQHQDNVRLDDKKTAVEKQILDLRQAYCKEEEQVNKVRQDEANLKNEVKALKESIKKLEKDVREAERTQSTLQEVEKSHMADPLELQNLTTRRDNLTAQLNDLNAKIESEGAQIDKLGEEKEASEEKSNGLDQKLKNLEDDIIAQRLKISKAEKEMNKELNGNLHNHQVNLYGVSILKLHKKVEDETRRFRRPIFGPIGCHLKLVHDATLSEARILETVAGKRGLEAFLCDNDQDRRTLTGLMNELNLRQRPKVFVTKYLNQKHRVKQVATRYPTLLELLEIKSPEVYNHVVDEMRLESIVLCPTQDVAKEITTRRENVPENMSQAISQDGYKFFPPSRNSNYRSYYMEIDEAKYLNPNIQDPNQLKRDEIDRLKADHRRMLNTTQQCENELQQETETYEKLQRLHEEAKKTWSVLRQEKSRLMNSSQELASQANSLGLDSQSFVPKIQALTAKISTWSTEILEKNRKVEQVESQLPDIAKKKEKRLADLNSKKPAEISDLEKKLAELRSAKDSKIKEIDRTTAKQKSFALSVAKLDREIKAMTKEHQEALKKAENNHSNVYPGQPITPLETPLSLKTYQVKYQELQKITRIEGQDTHTEEEMANQIQMMTRELKKQKSESRQLEENVKILKEANSQRMLNFLHIRKLLAGMLKRRFYDIARKFVKDMGGGLPELKIDLKKNKLCINIFEKDTEYKKDFKTLSGGEKSYIQMCLILSLWNSFHTPFRALDEWDVYLDPVNRKRISNQLLNITLEKEGTQYIFISPQGATDITSVLNSEQLENVEIIELQKQ